MAVGGRSSLDGRAPVVAGGWRRVEPPSDLHSRKENCHGRCMEKLMQPTANCGIAVNNPILYSDQLTNRPLNRKMPALNFEYPMDGIVLFQKVVKFGKPVSGAVSIRATALLLRIEFYFSLRAKNII
jgi:hypothetical protein